MKRNFMTLLGVKKELKRQFGNEAANQIYSEAKKKLQQLETEYPDLPERKLVFPAAALCLAIQEYEPEKALPFLRSFGEATGQKAAKLLHVISCLPGVPDLLWKRMDGIAKRMSSGYETKHVTVTHHKVEMDVVRCPIYESAKVLNAPEAAQFFCSMDRLYLTRMKGLHYERNQSLAEGDSFCDYRITDTRK